MVGDSIGLTIAVDQAGVARIARLGAGPGDAPGRGLPLVDVVVAGEGRAWSGRRYCESAAGQRLRYQGHAERAGPDGWYQLRVDLADPETSLAAEVFYRILAGQGTLRSWVRRSISWPPGPACWPITAPTWTGWTACSAGTRAW